MKKTIIIAIVLLVVVALGAFIISRLNGGSSAGIVAETPISATSREPALSSAPLAGAPQGSEVIIQTSAGAVHTKNFYTNAKGTWQEVDAVALEKTPEFIIWYYRGDSHFEIALSAEGTLKDVSGAESTFLKDLGISQADACRLNAVVSFIDDSVQGTRGIMPLSFCPNNVK